MVRLVQCLCGPNRHAILALAYQEGQVEDAVGILHRQVEELIASRGINPWCGICHARQEGWQYEDGPTKFPSIAEARPSLEAIQRANLRARDTLGQTGRN